MKNLALFQAKRLHEAVETGRVGISVDPNSALSHDATGRAEAYSGHCEEAIAHLKEAFRLSPRDPARALWHMDMGLGELCREHLDAAAQEFRQGIDGGFRTYLTYAFLAASVALLGKDAEAKTALAEARRLNPQFSIKWYLARNPSMPVQLEGFRKAGLPEE